MDTVKHFVREFWPITWRANSAFLLGRRYFAIERRRCSPLWAIANYLGALSANRWNTPTSGH